MKILIIGGNRFFGKKLAQRLIDEGHELSLLNRGRTDDELGASVKRIVCDRNDFKKLTELTKNTSWDIIFDQVCFDYKTAKEACEAFNGKVKKYIFTSTKSVYHPASNLKENDFNPLKYNFNQIEPQGKDYGEAKRQAEVAFFKYSNFPVTAVRFPIVIGNDDYTQRFNFHVERIKNQKPIFFPHLDAKISFISSDDAALTLHHLSKSDFTGPVNAASPSSISLKSFIKLIQHSTQTTANLAKEASDENYSPYGISEDWYACSELLRENGLVLPEVEDWLPNLINNEMNSLI